MNLIIGVTGSVATIKLKNLIEEVRIKFPNISIRVIFTKCSLHFIQENDIPEYCKRFVDQDEWDLWNKIGDPVLHIELRNWADAIMIAPLDANTMAKISNGICDNLLTCVLRAWDMNNKNNRVFLAPAMNTFMWNHPITAKQINILEEFGYNIIMPINKTLACGDHGIGGMAEIKVILEKLALLITE